MATNPAPASDNPDEIEKLRARIAEIESRLAEALGRMRDARSISLQQQEELHRATERFEVALRDSPIIVFNQDLDLRYTWIYSPELGYMPPFFIGKRDIEIFERAEDGQVTEKIKTEVIRTGLAQRHEVPVHWQDVDHYYDIIVEPQFDNRGAIVGVTGAAIDITDRKHAEQVLRQSESQFRSLFKNSLDAIFLMRLDGTIMAANPAACSIFRMTEEELCCAGRELLLDPDDPRHASVLEERTRKGKIDVELSYTRKDGTRFTAEVSSVILDGQSPRLFIVMRDISERKVAEEARRHVEEALRENRERLALAMEAGHSGTFDWNIATNTNRWSDSMLNLYGIKPEEFSGGYESWLEALLPEERQIFEEAVARALKTGEFGAEFRIRRRDTGEIRWLQSRAKVLFDEHGIPYRMLGINLDITDRKLTEEALIRSEKLASVGRMAMTVAHELNNPLEMIINSVYIASTDRNLSEQGRKYLDIAQQELKRVTHLTRQTLGFYREQSAPGNVDLPRLVADVIQFYEPKLIQRRIGAKQEQKPHSLVLAISGEIRQVLSNLLTNSIDAMPSGGIIRIRTSPAILNGERFVRMTVADTGQGIEPESLRKIFEPFFTTKESFGTGLGLWFSRDIILRHRGRIQVRSRQGRGTVFSILLPAVCSNSKAN